MFEASAGNSGQKLMLLERLTGELLLGRMDSTEMNEEGMYELHQPVRLMVHRTPEGIQVGVAPWFTFIPKESQKVEHVSINSAHILTVLVVEDSIEKSGSDNLHEQHRLMFSSIQIAPSLAGLSIGGRRG